jgi:hypothetical protein
LTEGDDRAQALSRCQRRELVKGHYMAGRLRQVVDLGMDLFGA